MPTSNVRSESNSAFAVPLSDRDRYLDLIERSLTRYESDAVYQPVDPFRYSRPVRRAWSQFQKILGGRDLEIVKRVTQDREAREFGQDVPVLGDTGVGLHRLRSLRQCIEDVLRDEVPGDLLETGVWRGGASIYMRAVLASHGVTDRTVWLADSFEGPPVPDLEKYPQDADIYLHLLPAMAVSEDSVKATAARYGLLDNQMKFLTGWFKDTLPGAPITNLSILRLDGDLYESTIQVLDEMYDRVSPGGYVVIDDYQSFPECRQATDDFRARKQVTEPLIEIDRDAVLWRKGSA